MEEIINTEKRGKPFANFLSKLGRKPAQDTTLDQGEQEASSPVVEPAEALVRSSNGWHVEDPAVPETTIDAEETHVLIGSEDFEAKINSALKKAQESLQHRQEARRLRDRSQSVLAQSESILEEAIHSVEAAGKAYGASLIDDSEANNEAVVRAQAMAETLRSRLKENQTAYQDALGQALGTKEMATRDLTAALDSLNFEVMNVEREWAESAKASSIADSVKESAIQDLLAVHTMWNGLASPHQEPLTPPGADLEGLITDEAGLPALGLNGNGVSDQVPTAAEGDAEVGEPAAAPKVDLSIEPIAGGREHAGAQATDNLPDWAGESASESLHRKLAGLTTMPDDGQIDLRSANDNGSNHAQPAVAVLEPMPNTPSRPVIAGAGLAQTCTGRVYLMFEAALTREASESVWDAVEEAAGSGVIIDTRLVSQDDGVQVTLDLDKTTLDVAAFLGRLPGAEIKVIAEDRLKVVWPANGVGVNPTGASHPGSRSVPG